jgi:endonuclease/exonuclease/phosphatase family metal-dependent hydrolase
MAAFGKSVGATALLIFFAGTVGPTAVSAIDLTVLSFNLRSGRGASSAPAYDERNLERFVSMVREFEPDAILLQEIDRGVARTDRVDQFEYLLEATGMNGRFAHTVDYQGGRFGIAVLTRHEVVTYEHVTLPQWGGKEPRALQHLRIRPADEVAVDLFNTHIDPRRISRDRQIELVFQTVDEIAKGPAVLSGDFNRTDVRKVVESIGSQWHDSATVGEAEKPTPGEHATASSAPRPTFPAWNPRIRIDYLFYKGDGIELVDLQIPDGRGISDHLPILARFSLDPE